jgi:ribosomal protein L34E
MGRIFYDRGNRMSLSHSRKGAALHRYYVSSALIQGQSEAAGSVARVPAAKIEAVIVDSVRRHIGHDAPIDNTELITTHVRQIEVKRREIAISLLSQDHATDDGNDNPFVLTVPWTKTPHRRHRDVIVPEGSSPAEALPIRSDTRARHRNRSWTAVVVRDRGGRRDNRRHRKKGGLQQAPRQYDDLAGLPRAAPRQSRRRRSTAPRDRITVWSQHLGDARRTPLQDGGTAASPIRFGSRLTRRNAPPLPHCRRPLCALLSAHALPQAPKLRPYMLAAEFLLEPGDRLEGRAFP